LHRRYQDVRGARYISRKQIQTGLKKATAINDLVSLLMPESCPGCHRHLVEGENFICLHCRHSLQSPSVMTMEALRHKFNLELKYVYAHWKFIQQGKAQRIIHMIKYGGSPRPARQLGREIAGNFPKSLDGILVPVPQHPFRTYRRGFNQALELAKAMASHSGLFLETGILHRGRNWHSQTKRSRINRLLALENTVKVRRGFGPAHYLLVDDVVTTGATLHTCADRILQAYPGSRFSIIVVATV
jgi:ComF family protein